MTTLRANAEPAHNDAHVSIIATNCQVVCSD